MVNSISKTTNVNIIRRSDYSRKETDSIVEVDIANKDSALNNNVFKDIITVHEKQKKKKQDKSKDEEKRPESEKEDSDQVTRRITDFYV